MKLNSGSPPAPIEARLKNTAGGNVSMVVSTPMRVNIWATASAILTSLV
jgi:hypothetical protein